MRPVLERDPINDQTHNLYFYERLQRRCIYPLKNLAMNLRCWNFKWEFIQNYRICVLPIKSRYHIKFFGTLDNNENDWEPSWHHRGTIAHMGLEKAIFYLELLPFSRFENKKSSFVMSWKLAEKSDEQKFFPAQNVLNQINFLSFFHYSSNVLFLVWLHGKPETF